ncbi:DNA/RNA non-specific endonuclease [Paenibacillus sinopodophylli]|uniref:DNA/RNA non-specific endonuclease n=1 Tax=Paenibacillus sinopodophylli TaxID=1837342 RepID=UPI00110CDFC4|nr:DNA/RNA non-specific endonuclease [Paenibacillus sinopodophylli]
MFAKSQPKTEAKTVSQHAEQPSSPVGQMETASGILLSAQEMMQLQKSFGNRAVQRMIQGSIPKNKVPDVKEQQPSGQSAMPSESEMQEEVGEKELEEVEVQAMFLDDILAMQPTDSKRSREEMERDIRLAQSTVDKVIAKCDNLDEVSAYFPLLQLRFGLKQIGFKDLGTPNAQVAMEINPKGACLFTNNNEFELNKGDSHGMPDKQDVKFKTGKSTTGHTWAKEMIASQLGPNHPQGFGPADQRNLMRHLPTNRKKHPGLENRYIRGHLLNDSLGGPGYEQNLFPITERANKDHEHFVESQVKSWVNESGHFVYYHVEVKNISEKIDKTLTDDSSNYVDADLHCEAYVLSVNGGRSKLSKYVNCVIKSKHGVVQAPQDLGVATIAGADNPDASHKKFVDNKWVELSVTKNKGAKGYDPVIEEVADGIMEFYNEVKKMIDKQQTIISTLAQLVGKDLKKVTPINLGFVLKAIILDSQGDSKGIAELRGSNFASVGAWNHITNELSKKKEDIADMLDALTHVIDEYHKLSAAEIEWLGQHEYTCYTKLVFTRMLDHYSDVDKRILNMKEAMYTLGWQAARIDNKNKLISDFFDAGYKDYLDGFARAESGADCNKDQLGYETGHQDYLDGLAAAQAAIAPASNYQAYLAAYDEYNDGLVKARQGHDPANPNKARVAAHDEYTNGRKDADGDQMKQHNTAAYLAGYEDYEAGLTDNQAGSDAQQTHYAYKWAFDEYEEGRLGISQRGEAAPARDGRAYEAGFSDYESGWVDAENGMNGPPAGHKAYQLGFNNYESGLGDAEASIVKRNTASAYTAAYDDYCEGFEDAQSDNGQNGNTAAYTNGYNEYYDGMNDASNQLGYQNGNRAYMEGYLEFEEGASDAEMRDEAGSDTVAYMEGYNSVDFSTKKVKTQ